VAPGSSYLFLAESGEYIIFYESQAVFKGKVYSTGESLPDLDIDVKNKTTGSLLYLASIILGMGVIMMTFFKRQRASRRRKEEESQNPGT